jgi:hypothetical protein
MDLFNFFPLLELPMLIAITVYLIAAVTIIQAGLYSAGLLP